MIATHGLTKHYRGAAALTDVDLDVPAGSVYGLVGPNGAGKTTLLGMLAGLRRPTAGEMHLASDRIAVLPDTPRFDRWLTGREVVTLARCLVADPDPDRVDTALVDAGLAEAADRAVGGYSRGMLQRLGMAATVVGDPEIVLLDEPASALDPEGRRRVLDLVARLRGHATVLFSSHILADVQEVCDRVGVLVAGRLVFQGPLDGLLAGAPSFEVRVRDDTAALVGRLRAASWVRDVTDEQPGVCVIDVHDTAAAEADIARVVAESGVRLISIRQRTPTLESVFLELTR